MAYRAVLFDLDGTLLDTLQDIGNSVNSVLDALGFPRHDIDAYRHFVGDGVDVLAMRALPEEHRDQKMVSDVTNRINEAYSTRWANTTRPFEGIPEMLNELSDNGIRLAVLSNKPQGFAGVTVSTLLSNWKFDIVAGAQPEVPKKPDPAAALQIAGRMGLNPGDFLFLGDSGVDMKTAVAAGMYPVGALWGFRTADELTASGAQALVEKPHDVIRLLRG